MMKNDILAEKLHQTAMALNDIATALLNEQTDSFRKDAEQVYYTNKLEPENHPILADIADYMCAGINKIH